MSASNTGKRVKISRDVPEGLPWQQLDVSNVTKKSSGDDRRLGVLHPWAGKSLARPNGPAATDRCNGV